ncbi:MAG: hypothetical protein CVT63_07265 [Candidatus Anoxymicrobium japonicum]|uniref:OsmC family protein n=1 Tax=Candidatus Anoxymicrobium japonicum TaxID=2013648 RepID=A0A2N3G4C2_9ACTN|nr:MAG: hypothetical protein CVT63_07265 [Candidatus Anoxymicrobium japonicum]
MGFIEKCNVESLAKFVNRATVRDFEFMVSKPVEKDGDDSGPMPSEYFLASLAACQAFSYRAVAEKRGVKIDELRVESEMELENGEVVRIREDVFVKSSEPKQKLEALEALSQKVCTIGKACRVPVEYVYHYA